MILKIIKNSLESGKCEYIKKYGHHFNKDLCWIAISKMSHSNKNPLSQEFVDTLLKDNQITLKNNIMYDYLYVANMGYFDYYGSSILDNKHLALFIKDYIDDEDGYEDKTFDRWITDIKHMSIEINWSNVI